MSWKIVVDSSSDYTPDATLKNATLDVIPMRLTANGTTYKDDANLDAHHLLQEMKASKVENATACPGPGEFFESFSQADNSIAFLITERLSGAYNSACVGRDMLHEQFAEKKAAVINSRSTAGILQLLTRFTDKLIGEGHKIEDIAEKVEEYAGKLRTVFTLSDYSNLIKSGRMSGFAGHMAMALNIHAVAIATREGEIDVIKKVRGKKKTHRAMVEYAQGEKDLTDLPVIISHCENPEDAADLAEAFSEKGADVEIIPCRGLTSFYAMQGGLIVAF